MHPPHMDRQALGQFTSLFGFQNVDCKEISVHHTLLYAMYVNLLYLLLSLSPLQTQSQIFERRT